MYEKQIEIKNQVDYTADCKYLSDILHKYRVLRWFSVFSWIFDDEFLQNYKSDLVLMVPGKLNLVLNGFGITWGEEKLDSRRSMNTLLNFFKMKGFDLERGL